MHFFRRVVPLLCRDRRAVTVLEYALIAGIIVATVLIGFTSLSNVLATRFTEIGNNLP